MLRKRLKVVSEKLKFREFLPHRVLNMWHENSFAFYLVVSFYCYTHFSLYFILRAPDTFTIPILNSFI